MMVFYKKRFKGQLLLVHHKLLNLHHGGHVLSLMMFQPFLFKQLQTNWAGVPTLKEVYLFIFFTKVSFWN